MGPFSLGTTRDLVGVYEIYYRLHILIRWGTQDYRKWFNENVLNWLRERIPR